MKMATAKEEETKTPRD